MKRAPLVAIALLAACGMLGLSLGACGDDDAGLDAENTFDASTGSSGVGSSGAPDATVTPPTDRCAVETLGGALLPLEINLLLDVSSSMCFVTDPIDGGGPDAGEIDAGDEDAGDAGPVEIPGHFDCTDARSRWPAASQALRTFLSSPDTTGLTLAVRTFGPVDSWDPITVESNRCASSHYETTDYEATDLPSQQFANRVAAIAPNTSHPDATQTQTGAVITGSTVAMKARQVALAGTKGVAMVLLTDGDPQGCDPSLAIPKQGTAVDYELAYAAAEAAAAQGVKLYVLAIGGTKTVLDEIARRGGTEAAITIDDPTNTTAIGDALESIRTKALSCSVRIPKPAQGNPDFEKLDVVWTPRGNGGAEQVLPQSTDCSEGRGWRYDDPANPTTIELCATVCAEVTASTQGKLEIVLGCTDPVTVP